MNYRAPDVSVVISTYNRAKHLDRALVALLRQEGTEQISYEILVVDNNSRDNTRGVVESHIGHPQAEVRYLFEARQGVSYGRNAGIAAARAPIVAFTDDDNEVDSRWIQTIKTAMDARPDVPAIGGRILPDWPSPVPSWLDRRHWSPLAILDYGEHPFATSQANPVCLLTANLAMRRETLEWLGGFAPEFHRCQDHELMIRLWKAGREALYVPSLIVRTRIAPERLTRRYHRAWHWRHGSYSADMRLQEIIDGSGRLAEPPSDAARLRGTPGFVYRELGRELGGLAVSALRFDRPRALYHRDNVSYLVAYIRRTSLVYKSPRWLVLDVAAFGSNCLRKRAAIVRMRPARVALAAALVAIVVGGSAWDIAADQEDWPFSAYAMFSQVEREPRVEQLRVVGVADMAGGSEMPLLDSSVIAPFDQCRLATAFARTYDNPARRAQTDAMLRDVLARYEASRLAGRHDGPPLSAVRLYRMQWHLDPDARNRNAPDVRQLLREVQASTGAAP